MEAIILAGGLGTRLRSVVPDLPKPLAPILGRPFLAHLLDYWIAQGVTRAILSVGYMHERIQEALGESYHDCRISYAIEAEPLGTGGGLLLAAQQLREDGPFLVLNGDTFFQVNMVRLEEFHLRRGADVTLALFETRDLDRYAAVGLDSSSRVTAWRAAVSRDVACANGGVYLMGRRVLVDVPFASGEKFSLEENLMPGLISNGTRIYGYQCSGGFIDIGVPGDYLRAGDFMRNLEIQR